MSLASILADRCRCISIVVFTAFTFNLASAEFTLTILHTNDVHARVEQTDTYSIPCPAADAAADRCYAGVARRHAKIKELRKIHDNVLLLDAGDQFSGTPWFSVYGGLEASYFMNMLGYDAMSLGNHEFQNGVDGLVSPFLANATFPVICANLDTSNEPRLRNIKRSVVKTINGHNIAIVGYVTKTFSRPDPDGLKTVKINDEIESVRAEVDRLKEQGHDKILVLGHGGYELDKDIAKAVDGVDVVIGGHSHTLLYSGEQPSSEPIAGPYPTVITQPSWNTVLVATAYCYGKYLGFLQVTFDDNGKVKSSRGSPILLDGTVEEDPVTNEAVHVWSESIQEYRSTIVGETYVYLQGDPLQCRLGECNVGNLITDAIVQEHARKPGPDGWGKVRIALWNSGSIRASIQQGSITLGNVLDALPFRSEVQQIELKGRHLREMLEHAVSEYNPGNPSGMFLQVAGLRVIYDVWKPVNHRVRLVQVQCAACSIPKYEPLLNNQVYSLLTSDFLINGGDGYDMIQRNLIRREPIGPIDSDVLIDYLATYSPIIIGLDGRIVVDQLDRETRGHAPVMYEPLHGVKLIYNLLMQHRMRNIYREKYEKQ